MAGFADTIAAAGPFDVVVACVSALGLIVVGALSLIGALSANKAKKNTQSNGGSSPHDVTIANQEYSIGLIHGLTSEMRDRFDDATSKASEAARLAALAAAKVDKADIRLGIIQNTLSAHIDGSDDFRDIVVAEGNKVLERLEALENGAQGHPEGT